MAKTTYLATAPDGTQFTRGTQTREYPYAVLCGPANAEALAKMQDDFAISADRKADLLDAALIEPVVQKFNRGFTRAGQDPDVSYDGKPNYNGFELRLKGIEWRTSEITLDVRCNSKGETDWGWYTGNASTREYGAPREIVDARTELLAEAESKRAGYRQAAIDARAQAAGLRDGSIPLTAGDLAWGCLRWTSRLDLANSYVAAEFGYYERQGRDLLIVETTIKPKRGAKA